VSECVVS